MLFLTFQIGGDRYALSVSEVIEVLPLVELREVLQAPLGVAGFFDCRGVLTPVIDMSVLALGRPAERCLSTRIVLVGGTKAMPRPLGLIAERTTATLQREPADFADTGIANPRARYLGPVTRDERGLVQWIDPSRLLPDAVREALFESQGEWRWPLPTSQPS